MAIFQKIKIIILVSLWSVFGLAQELVLFHAGAKQYLQKNVDLHGVSQPDWDHFIMPKTSNNANFKLNEYREGFYGAEQLSEVGLYSFYQLQNGVEPQIIILKVKDSCLSRDKKFDANYKFLPISKDNIFSTWIEKNKNNLEQKNPQILNRCRSILSVSDQAYWKEGQPYGGANSAEDDDDPVCQDILNQFLVENDIKVIKDVVNDSSWYIRDRSCIEDILGTANDFLQYVTQNKIGPSQQYLVQNLYGDIVAPGHVSMGLTFVILRSLSEAKNISADKNINLNALLSDINASLQDDKKVKKPVLDNNYDNVWILKYSLEAFLRARRNNKQAEFQSKLGKHLDQILQGFKINCSGEHGIPESKVRDCHRNSVLESAQLIQLLNLY